MVTPSVYNVWYSSYSRLRRQNGRPLDRAETAAAWRAVKASPIEFSKWRQLADKGSTNTEPNPKKRKRKAKDVGEGLSQPGKSKQQSREKKTTMQDHLSRVVAPAVYLRPAYEPETSDIHTFPNRTMKPKPMRYRSPDDHMVPPISHLLRDKLRHTEPSGRPGAGLSSITQGATGNDASKKDTSIATAKPIESPSLQRVPPAWSLEQYIHDEYLL